MSTTTEAPWRPTDDQMNDEVAPVLADIHEQLMELQASTGCPTSFLVGMLENAIGRLDLP